MIKRGSERIDVGPGTLCLAIGGVLLLRRVAELDQARHLRRALGRSDPAGGAEVEQNRITVRADDDIVRRDIAMQETGFMQGLERIEKGIKDAVHLILCRPAAEFAHPGLEAAAFLELHDHVGGAVRLEDRLHAHDGALPELGERAGLLDEAQPQTIEQALITAAPGANAHRAVAHAELGRIIFLERNRGVEADIVRGIGDAEPASADDALDPVLAVENEALRQNFAEIHGRRAPAPAISYQRDA